MGRLHSKDNLMNELKISRILKKFDYEAPHEVMLVLDVCNSQNAVALRQKLLIKRFQFQALH